jgi:hypothetical protein
MAIVAESVVSPRSDVVIDCTALADQGIFLKQWQISLVEVFAIPVIIFKNGEPLVPGTTNVQRGKQIAI